MIVLGIESSCDETGVALYCTETKKILAEALHSQIDLHRLYGGVVPELAARDHIQRLPALVRVVLAEAQIQAKHLGAIAYTAMPGLVGALMVGAAFAKAYAYALDIPAIAVHHMEGHLLAPFLEEGSASLENFDPFVALLVSGGHTQLIEVKGLGQYRLLGETMDDAAGETFDKTAKLLGLPYPGGPELSKLAKSGIQDRFTFPRPMLTQRNCHFSFSGLKTSVVTLWKKLKASEKTAQIKADIALAFEEAVVDTLVSKSIYALKQTNMKVLLVAGGVSANHRLRAELTQRLKVENMEVLYPDLQYCTDNGAMIALAGAMRLISGEADVDLKIRVHARESLS